MGQDGSQRRPRAAPRDASAPQVDAENDAPSLVPAALRRDQATHPLHSLLREHLNAFLARFEDNHGGRRLPGYVEDEFRALLRCGDPTYGFARFQCRSCSSDLLVPFSCKGRGFCPSCGGRRMNEIAAHLVERVLPPVPVRQWVLSLPWHLRLALASDPVLLRSVSRAFIRAVNASYRRRARKQLVDRSDGASPPKEVPPQYLTPGAVNFVQRIGSSLGLNVHFHAIFLDGVHINRGPSAPPEFLPAPELQPEEVARVHSGAMRRIHRTLRRAGRPDLIRSLNGEADVTDAGSTTDDSEGSLLPFLHAASIQDRIALITDPLTCRNLLRHIGASHHPLLLAPARPLPTKPSTSPSRSEKLASSPRFSRHPKRRVGCSSFPKPPPLAQCTPLNDHRLLPQPKIDDLHT